jgi:SsrA-binding protein
MALIENKKARFDYEILDRYEAGAVLLGHEVKALRAGKGSLEGARVGVRGGEAFLIGATIQPYQVGNTPKGYDVERSRRLLLSKKEIAVLAGAEGQKGLTIVPLKWYNSNRKLKLAIAVARHKKKYDKRASLKERDTKREIGRTLKNEYR